MGTNDNLMAPSLLNMLHEEEFSIPIPLVILGHNKAIFG